MLSLLLPSARWEPVGLWLAGLRIRLCGPYFRRCLAQGTTMDRRIVRNSRTAEFSPRPPKPARLLGDRPTGIAAQVIHTMDLTGTQPATQCRGDESE